MFTSGIRTITKNSQQFRINNCPIKWQEYACDLQLVRARAGIGFAV